jgi:DNA mismatch repair protein MutS2
VRVVHGHGTGALRKVVREVLSSHPVVAHFAHPPQHRGGTGVTEAELDSR